MKRLINSYKRCWHMRNDYHIVWKVKFAADKQDYLFSFLPTIMWSPFPRRYPNTYLFDIHWLYFHIGIGYWTRKED